MKLNSTMFFALAAYGVASVFVFSSTVAVAGPLTDPAQMTHCKAVGVALGKKAKEFQVQIDEGKHLDVASPKDLQDIEKLLSDRSKTANTVYGSASPPQKAEQKMADSLPATALIKDLEACWTAD